MPSAALYSFFQGLLLVGSAVTAIKLFSTGLYKKYPFFFIYFVFRVPNSIWPLLLDIKSDAYFYFYICTLPLQIVLYILLVMELYRLVLEQYKGLQSAGKWIMYVSLAGAVTVSILTLIPKIQPSMAQRSKAMGFVIVSERGVYTALAVFIILLLALLSFFPIQLRRNVRLHALIYSIFFLNGGMVMLSRTVLGMKARDTVNVAGMVINLGCVVAWLLLLKPAGETVADHKAVSSNHERRLMLQLEGLNAALLRVSRPKIG